MLQKIIVICGPTSVGKTHVGLKLAKEFNGEIVYADSAAVYKELDIGTAKPTLEERGAITHHLIDVANPGEQFNAGRYVELADKAIAGIIKKGRLPFIVGGTGLYIRALIHGLAAMPERDEGYRAELTRLNSIPPSLYQLLQAKDPVTAARLKPNDSSRIIRALEVLHVTGCSISKFQKGHAFKNCRYGALKIGLNIDRRELYRRIDERVDRMMKDGLVEEVKTLIEKYGVDAPALKAVGYREIVDQVRQVDELTKLVELIKQNTRHLAKRQLTWFRADRKIRWFDPSEMKNIEKAISDFTER